MVAPQKVKHRITVWSSDPISGYVPQRTEGRDSNKHLCTSVHNSIIHNNENVEISQMSIDGWMDKQNAVCICNGPIASKGKENLIHATLQMNLEDIMISEASHMETMLYNSTYRRQIHRDRKWKSGYQGLGWTVDAELSFNGYRVSGVMQSSGNG